MTSVGRANDVGFPVVAGMAVQIGLACSPNFHGSLQKSSWTIPAPEQGGEHVANL